MNKTTLTTLLIVLLLSNIYLLYCFRTLKTYKDEKKYDLIKHNLMLKSKIKSLKSNLILNLVGDSIEFKNLELRKLGTDNFMHLRKIVNLNAKLIIYLPSQDCMTCLKNEIELFSDYINKIENDKILILTTKWNREIIYKVINESEFKIYELKDSYSEILGKYTFYTILDTDLNSKYIHYPNPESKELISFYFKFISESLDDVPNYYSDVVNNELE